MKKSILTTAAAVIMAAAAISQTPADTTETGRGGTFVMAPGPRLTLASRHLDLGDVATGSRTIDSISFRNTGTEPLVIKSIFSQCGCTAPSFPRDTIAPGEGGWITIRFDAGGVGYGKFRKRVRVKSNALNATETIYVEGKIHSAD